MLFPADTLAGIAQGAVTMAFRRWDRPRVRAGGSQRTRVGVVAFDAVEQVDPDRITPAEAQAAGHPDLASLLAVLEGQGDKPTWRIRLRLAGPDPRVALRAQADIDDAELERIRARLARLDAASRHGPWTRTVLERIRDRPATRAADLAADFRRETQDFKRDVRKLKELGLTESLDVGYCLSPRGRAVLDRLTAAP
jgi:hypothetical protein